MPSTAQIVAVIVGVALVVLFGNQFVLPAMDRAQGPLTVTLEQSEGNSVNVHGPYNSTLTDVRQNPDEVDVEIENTETGETENTTIAEGSTKTITVGGDDINATVDTVESANTATMTYEMDRDVPLSPEGQSLIRALFLLLLVVMVAMLIYLLAEVVL